MTINPGQLRSYRNDGLVFDVHEGGRGPGRELVILLHGFPQDASSYELITPALHAAGYWTLAPDQRGYSPGARPAGIWRYQIKNLVADVLALADAVGVERFHLVGHDWGAMIAWEVARRHPQRVRSLTSLSIAHPLATARAARSGAQLLKSYYIFGFQIPLLVEAVSTAIGVGRGLGWLGMPEPFASRYGRRFATMADLWGPLAWYRAFGLAWFDTEGRDAPPEVSVPTTLIWGNRDAYVDRRSAELTTEFVTGDYRFVELDADHWLPERYPEQLAPLIIERLQTPPVAGRSA